MDIPDFRRNMVGIDRIAQQMVVWFWIMEIDYEDRRLS